MALDGCSQPQLIRDMRERHGFDGHVRTVSTPLVARAQFFASCCDSGGDLSEFAALGCLFLYLASTTRPDLAYAAGALARFMSAPTSELVSHARHVCRYLCGTADLELTLGGLSCSSPPPLLRAWSNNDFAGSATGRSVAGIVVQLLGSSVLWRSVKLPIVVKSATAAEYVAASLASDEVVYMRSVATELGLTLSPVPLLVDSSAAVSILQSGKVDSKT
jgi:hypothetical protein